MSEVVIVDSGVANLASVQAAFARLGARCTVARDAAAIRQSQRIVLPGVGAFGPAMRSLRNRGLDTAVEDVVAQGTPVLAICLGLQLLCEESDESPGVKGLGVIRGRCQRLPEGQRVPHVGWNVVEPESSCRFLQPMDAVFANSYALGIAPPGWTVAWTTHGSRFVAALEQGRVLACQFHPELSGPAGSQLLDRWLRGSTAATRTSLRAGQLAVRIVPCLDVRDDRVVKGIRFQELRDAGDPVAQAVRYEAEGADEIVLLDIEATATSRSAQLDTVRRVRRAIGISLTAGGGVRSVEDAQAFLNAGADKVSVNSAAVARPSLLSELARSFGCQCVVLAIDARRGDDGWHVLVRGGRDVVPSLDAVTWAHDGESLGAGEILLTSWDRDGTRAGSDVELLRAVRSMVRVPIIASGGIGTRAHVAAAVAAGADAVLAASVFHDREDTVAGIKGDLARRGVVVRA